jgi:leader peptidase (prepilin peptidase)/N-methyltransferase
MPGTDDDTMVALIGFVATGAFATQTFWLVARAFGPPAVRLAVYDGRTIAFGAIGSLLLGLHDGGLAKNIPDVLVVAAAAVSTTTDERCGLIFDVVTFPAALAAALAAALGGHGGEAVLGACTVGGALWLLHAATRGRGLGLGDAKLAAVVGAAFGAVDGLVAIGVAFVVGALCTIAALCMRRIERGAEVRFAPYVLCGVLAACGGVA